jgi:signal transduction histidine kinase/CheY-like chemotaxis protein
MTPPAPGVEGEGTLKATNRPSRFGIVPKVLLALVVAFAASLDALLLVGSGFKAVGDGLDAIAETYLPALVRTAELVRESHRLVAYGPDILLAGSELVREDLAAQMERIAQGKDRLMADLRAGDVPAEGLDPLERHFDALVDNLGALIGVANRHMGVEQATAVLIGRLQRISELIGRLGTRPGAEAPRQGDNGVGGCLARWQAHARQAIIELLAAQGAREEGQLGRRRQGFARSAAGMETALACLPGEGAGAVRALHTEIRALGGEGGLIDLHRQQLALRYTMEDHLWRGRYLAEALMGSVNRLFTRLQDETRARSQAVQRTTRERLAMLALVPVLLSVIVLATYLYLNRALLAPIVRLRRAMQDHLSGREAHFPDPGRDEVGAIIRAVRGFIDTLADREAKLRAATAVAERASKAKSLFLAHMSHELRTPLNTILGYADLLRQAPGLDAEGRVRCRIIRRSGAHLLALIDDLLDVASIEAGRLHLAAHPVDLDGLLGEVEGAARREAEAKGLSFRACHGPGLPAHVRVDGRRLRQVLLNLLGNAVKYTPAGQVTFEVSSLGGAADDGTDSAEGEEGGDRVVLHFVIADSGPGIPAEHQARLFEPFEQLHVGQEGSGLGLAISLDLVTLMGGALGVASEPGMGSRFWFEVPVQRVAREPVCPQGLIVGYRGERRRILVVDDQAESRKLLGEMLSPLGFAVDLADGAQGALCQAVRAAPDLVLMDLVMPGYCGYAAACALREQAGLARLPVVAVSATVLGAPADARVLGFNAILVKPVERDVLLATVAQCLDLTWVREDEALPEEPTGPRAPPPADPENDALDTPSRVELETVQELARLGQWERVLEWCDDLEAGQPEYAPFARRVRPLANAAERERLLRWLAEHLRGH